MYIWKARMVDNIIYFDGNSWKLMDPTFASSSGQSQEIMQYIGNGSKLQGKIQLLRGGKRDGEKGRGLLQVFL